MDIDVDGVAGRRRPAVVAGRSGAAGLVVANGRGGAGQDEILAGHVGLRGTSQGDGRPADARLPRPGQRHGAQGVGRSGPRTRPGLFPVQRPEKQRRTGHPHGQLRL